MCLANRNTDGYFYDTEMSWYEMSKALEATGQKVWVGAKCGRMGNIMWVWKCCDG